MANNQMSDIRFILLIKLELQMLECYSNDSDLSPIGSDDTIAGQKNIMYEYEVA